MKRLLGRVGDVLWLKTHTSHISILSDYFLVYMVLRIGQFLDCLINHSLEWVFPHVVKFFKFLIPSDTVLSHVRDEILTCLGILFCLDSLWFNSRLSIFFWLFCITCLTCNWRENCGSWENFVKVLELLASSLLITIRYGFVIDFNYIWEAVHNECTQENCVRNFVFLYGQAHQICERL